jgi:hypothetical protein
MQELFKKINYTYSILQICTSYSCRRLAAPIKVKKKVNTLTPWQGKFYGDLAKLPSISFFENLLDQKLRMLNPLSFHVGIPVAVPKFPQVHMKTDLYIR